MAAVSCVEELLGVRSCSLVGSGTEVSKGRRLQTFDLRYSGAVATRCPSCGGVMHSHGARSMGIVSTPHLGAPTKLSIEFPRMRCASCGYVWRPEIEGVDESHRMTEAAYADIAQRSLRLTFREVAEEYPLSHVTVKNVFEDYVRENASRLRFKVPAFLGIDEKNLKRVGMVTVITDLEHRTVFDMVPGRTQADLDSYFSRLDGLDRVRWVSSDMYRPFWKSIAKYTPTRPGSSTTSTSSREPTRPLTRFGRAFRPASTGRGASNSKRVWPTPWGSAPGTSVPTRRRRCAGFDRMRATRAS